MSCSVAFSIRCKLRYTRHAKTPIILAGVFGTLGAFIIFVILLFLWKHRRASSSSSTWHLSNFSWRQSAGPTLPLQMPGTTQRQTASPASLISRPQTTYSNGMLGPLPSSSSLGSSSAQSAQSNATDVSPRLVLDTKRLTLQRLEGNPRYTLGTSPSDMGDDPFADPLAIVRARGNRMEPSPTIRRSDASESSVYSTTYAAPEASTSNMLPNPFRDPGLSVGVYSQGSSPMPSPRSGRQSTQGSSNLRNEYVSRKLSHHCIQFTQIDLHIAVRVRSMTATTSDMTGFLHNYNLWTSC